MTAPTRTRPAPTRRAPRPAPRTSPAPRPRGNGRPSPAQRAYSRKAARGQRWRELVPDPRAGVAVARRVPFVVLVIGLLGFGLVATLWLSTNAAAGSYQLSAAQKENRLLTEKAETLHRDVATMSSAASLARRAEELGMVPTSDVARLLVGPDGSVTVVGKPEPAAASAPPPLEPPAPASAPASAPAPASAAPAPDAPAAPAEAAPTPTAAPPASATPAPPPAPAAGEAPAVGAPTQPPAPPQAHSEQIQPGPDPVADNGGA